MRLKTLAACCTLGLMVKPVYAAYNCYDYCNAGALQMIEQGYVLHGQLLAGWGMSGLAGLATELRYSNNNLMVTGQLGTTLYEYARKVDATNMQSALNSYAEIRKRLSMAVSERQLRQSYPVAKAAQSVNALGQIITADGLSKAGEAGNVCRADGAKAPATNDNGGQKQNTPTPGGTQQGGNADDKDKDKQDANKKPLNFNGSPEENAQALFEVFNRLKLTTTGVQAIAYVNPLTSRNLGAQPNQIYTIYTQRPMGNPYQEAPSGTIEKLQDEEHANQASGGTNAQAENNPNNPESVFALWAQSPLIEPGHIDQIFMRHSVDLEIFELYKNYQQAQSGFNDQAGLQPPPSDPTTSVPPADGADRSKPPFKNATPFSANHPRAAQLANKSCTWDHGLEHNANSGKASPKNRNMTNREIVIHYAKEMDYPPALILAQVVAESSFRNHAVSNVGARGMVQFMPGTALDPHGKRHGWYHTDRSDPHQNIPAAINYMRYILNKWDNDILVSLGGYNAGPNRKSSNTYFKIGETNLYMRKIMCYSKMMLRHNGYPPVGATEYFDFKTDLPLITALGFNANGANFYLPLSGHSYLRQKDEYGMEKYGIFVENSNAYRNVERTDLSLLFSWLALQYNSDLTAEILGKVFAHMDEPPGKEDVGVDKSIEASSGIVKTEKQEKLGIGNEMVTKSEDGKSSSVKPGSSIHEELVNNYAQYLSAYWFDPVVIPPGVYPDTDRMTTAQLNKFYTYVRKRLEMGGTPTRIGTDRVPLQVLKALAEGGNEAYQIAFAQSAATGQKPPPREQYESPQARDWIAEATISELNRGLVNATLVDMLEFRLRPDKSSWPSYNSMALHMVQHPDDLGKVISPSLALDMALYSAYNPVKHLITPEEALELRSYYSHGYYPFMRYYGDDSTPVGEEPNRITEQVVLDKTVNYIRDPKFYEFMETASGDDLNRQLPRYVGTESYIAYRRLKEAQNRRRLLIAWAGAAVANGYSTDSGDDDTSIGMEERISRSGREATAKGNFQ